MPTVDVRVYYLEMHAPNGQQVAPPRPGLAVLHARKPTLAYYRFLYHSVGAPYHWYTRGRLPDAELAASLAEPTREIHVLHVEGTPAGFAELDRHIERQVELVQFGLMPEFIGQGLGAYFLQWTIDQAWSYRPRRFWLHTCTLDHPRALPNYQKAGFAIFKEDTIRRVLD